MSFYILSRRGGPCEPGAGLRAGPPLCSFSDATIVLVQANVRQALSALRHSLEELYGQRLVSMILYGSQARGDARPWSDIDLLVVLKGSIEDHQEWNRVEDLVAALCREYDVVMSPVFVAEDDYVSGDRGLLHNVRREGVPV